jgi:hypothetical protein
MKTKTSQESGGSHIEYVRQRKDKDEHIYIHIST